jgi:hypothetical protein
MGFDMPVKQENKHRYPKNWKTIALQVKNDANWTCQHCGKPCRKTGVDWFDFEMWLYENHVRWWDEIFETQSDDKETRKPQRFTLTVAHHPNPSPENCDRSNLIALCAPCHLKLDANLHAANAAATRRQKRDIQTGQINLLDEAQT